MNTQLKETVGKTSLSALPMPRAGLSGFWSEEKGSMSILAMASAVVMMVFGGIAIDMIHSELKRTKVQNTLDRAVLAAADLEQTLDATLVVEDYFAKMKMPEALTSVTIENGLNFKKVTATGHLDQRSNFLKYLGVDNLRAAGKSVAEEKINKVEISLVLDISGSMANNQKMKRLKGAASTFIDTVLDQQTDDLISISLVPYSEQVNAGPLLTEQLNVNWKHGFSHCLEFPDEQFASAALDTTMTYEQMQHYQWNYFGNNSRSDTVCPRYNYERITPFSQDPVALKAQINELEPRAGTSIFLGMKWGAALLDPSTRTIASNLIGSGNVDAGFQGRPVDYADTDTIKTVVLMTDGQHDRSFRLADWAYDSESEIANWDKFNLWYYLVNNVSSNAWGGFYEQKYNASTGDSLLSSICGAAKHQGIVIWSIGFEVTDHGANVMRDCASSPSHFFRVEGVAIEDAFYSIARTINQLRLTQ